MVENAFGMLVSRRRALNTSIIGRVENIESYVLATLALHNYLGQTENAHYYPAGIIDSEDSSGEVDTVDHDILLEKLSHYGIKNTEHKWFSSYLGNRRQCCRVNGIISNFENITCVVPQGSCLGPLLFLLYINDLPCALNCSKVTMYADDTSLAYSAKDVKDITSTMNAELENLKVWLHGNKLSLNLAKTTSMLIGTRHSINDKITAEPLRANFVISGEHIEQKPSVKYLGVHIDNKLKWKDHIKAVASKVTRAIAMIRHSKKLLPKHTLKMLYQGLVEPHFRFCCSVWGSMWSHYPLYSRKVTKQSHKNYNG